MLGLVTLRAMHSMRLACSCQAPNSACSGPKPRVHWLTVMTTGVHGAAGTQGGLNGGPLPQSGMHASGAPRTLGSVPRRSALGTLLFYFVLCSDPTCLGSLGQVTSLGLPFSWGERIPFPQYHHINHKGGKHGGNRRIYPPHRPQLRKF